MSVQSRLFSGPQIMNAGNFAHPAPPSAITGGSSSLNVMSLSSSSTSTVYRHSPRDPFALSAPPTTTVSTLPGTGGLFLSPSVNSHTGFVPTRTGPAAKQEMAPVLKPPKPPEKPLMPYMRYSRRMWEKVRLSNPDSKLWDIGKIIGQMWRELPDPARQVYVDEYEAEKVDYDKALKAYHNSPGYQAYLLSKNRSRGGEKPATSSVGESGVFIQPVDEDEGESGQFSVKHLSASRFHRNHRLMKEIFSEAQVPDARNVITAQRLGVLKKQVTSLTLHQNKLEEELKQLEAKFDSKKRKMAESSTQFSSTLKKLCSHRMEPFEELVEKSKAHLLNAYEKYKVQERKQQEAQASGQAQVHAGTDEPVPDPTPTDAEQKPDTAAGSDQRCGNLDEKESANVASRDATLGNGNSGIGESKAKPKLDTVGVETTMTEDQTQDQTSVDSAVVMDSAVSMDTTTTTAHEGNVTQKRSEDAPEETDGRKNDDAVGENNETSLSSLPPDDSSENSQEA